MVKKVIKEAFGKAGSQFLLGFDFGAQLGATFGNELTFQLEKIVDNSKSAAAAAAAKDKSVPVDRLYTAGLSTGARFAAFSIDGSCDTCIFERTYFVFDKTSGWLEDLIKGPKYTWSECACINAVGTAKDIGGEGKHN